MTTFMPEFSYLPRKFKIAVIASDTDRAAMRLHDIGITVNRNAVPFDPRPPMVTSGLRLGTPASTTRGFKQPEIELVADLAHRLQPVLEFAAEFRARHHRAEIEIELGLGIDIEVVSRIERKGLRQMLIEPEFLATVEADGTITFVPSAGTPSTASCCMAAMASSSTRVASGRSE